jgi:hypothetical protein
VFFERPSEGQLNKLANHTLPTIQGRTPDALRAQSSPFLTKLSY